MFENSYKLFRVWGIPIKIHVSLLLLMGWVIFSSSRHGSAFLGLNVLFVVCIFTSIALHELGHSLVALRKGCRVREITLLFIGGAAQMERMPSRPRDEFQMAIAGPLVSLSISAACWFSGVAVVVSLEWGLAGMFLLLLARTNLLLALFNLIPAFPMDGGRVLRALLSARHGRLRATYLAARVGRTVAMVGGAAALLNLFRFFGLDLAFSNRLVIAAIALFVYRGAGAEYRAVQIQEMMKHGGFGFWPHGVREEDLEDEDRVIVGPPPYGDGPDRELPLRPVRRRHPFGGWFGR